MCTRVGQTPSFTPAEIEQLKAGGKNNVEIFMPATQDELNKLLPECDVVFGQLNAATLAKAKNLKWVQNLEAGLEREMFPELVAHPCAMTNMARMYAPALGETAMAMLLALTRGIQKYYVPLYDKKEWKPARDLVEIGGKTMGIVAMGGLGQATAKIAHYGFDMKILAVDIKPMAKPVFVDTLREPEWLMEMVPQVDVLVCCCPLTPVSRGMISDKVFRAMKKTAYFINMSRGPLMDENALAAALKEGRIAGAGSDPGPVEPYPRHWRSLGLPEHDIHATQRWILARTPDPSHGAAGRERPPLRARLAADERGGQRARLLIREEVLLLLKKDFLSYINTASRF